MNSQTFESTYALLVRSEEKERSRTEMAVYFLLILSMIFSIWEAAHMRVTIPENLSAKPIVQTTVCRANCA